MDDLLIVLRIAIYNFRKWLSNPRFAVTFILTFGMIKIALDPVSRMSQASGIGVAPFAFVFLMNDTYIVFMIAISLILLFCDAPFIDSQQPYIMIRSGKNKWLAGQIVYICLASFIYVMFVQLVSILCLIPNLEFVNGWGKIWGTLAQTDAASVFQIRLHVPHYILLNFKPIQASIISMFMSWLIFTFTGLIMFVINLKSTRIYGAIIATLFALLPFVSIFTPRWFKYISPYTWIGLEMSNTYYISFLPIRTYAIGTLIFIIICCSFISYTFLKKKAFDVLPPV